MIPFLRPSAALPLLLAVLVLPGSRTSLRAADDDAAARKTEATELLKAMNVEQTVANASKRMLTSMDGIADRMGKQPNLTPDQTADIQKFREEMHALVDQQLGWDAFKADMVQAYADDFTEAELKEMDAFYHSPAGQKLVSKQPELSEKLGKAMQQKSMVMMPTIQQKIRAVSAKVRPAPPVPPVAPPLRMPTAGGPAGSPAASPAAVVVVPAATPASATPAATAVTAPVPAPAATAPFTVPAATPPATAPATTPAS